jgi:hypothetical protein
MKERAAAGDNPLQAALARYRSHLGPVAESKLKGPATVKPFGVENGVSGGAEAGAPGPVGQVGQCASV